MAFPKRCPICGNICTPRGELVCNTCRTKPVRIEEPRCKKCSKPISSGEFEYCYDCSMKEFHYVRGYSLWMYDDVMKDSIAAYKYKGRKEYTKFYVNELVKYLGDEILCIAPDAIIPIPVHPARRRQRGYNQAELLALELGTQLHIIVRTDILIRTIKTRPQKELDNIERMRNLEKAFSIAGHYKKASLGYHKVILIDDIYTTGSTIEACTKVLISAGVKEIYFVTLCIGQGY